MYFIFIIDSLLAQTSKLLRAKLLILFAELKGQQNFDT